jgi:putative flippase GtrA
MQMSPATVLDKVTGGRGELAIKYSAVSVVGVVLTQALLVLMLGLLDWPPVQANVAAVMVTTIPVFILNKRWVWSSDGKIDLKREVIPFWIFTMMGLALSTGLVALVHNLSDSHLLVMAANMAGFGILWIAKFLFLDQIMFGHLEIDEVLSQLPADPEPA